MIEKIICGIIEIDSTARHDTVVELKRSSLVLDYTEKMKKANRQTERQTDSHTDRHTDTLPSKQTNQSPTFSFARNRSSKSDGGKSNTRAPTSAFAAILRTGKLDDI